MDDLFQSIAEVGNPGSGELGQFTRDVEEFLDRVLTQPDFGFLWLDNRPLQIMAQTTFEQDVRPAAANLRDSIPGINDRAVELHGLRGRALRFKLNVIASVARGWRRVRGTLAVRRWFRRMVEAIDATLESLIDAAAGIGGVLKEFKDSLLALSYEE